jgi:uncharacterized protein YecE (DUF72 family)
VGVILGTSGWQYRSWKEVFYGGVTQKQWLQHYCDSFDTVEINNSFYRLPDTETFSHWHDETPDSFVFAPKMSRYLTHVKRLKDPAEPVQRFLEHAQPLKGKLGPILIQLPPTLKADAERLDETLKQFPSRIRIAVEFRHDSWFQSEINDLLCEHNAALCLNDGGAVKTPLWRTADWAYMRFHAGKASPPPCYGTSALTTWVKRLTDQWSDNEDIYVYFNNDPHACALLNAAQFAGAVERAGRQISRAPRTADMQLS